jgi:hypothetical protein
MQGNRKEVALTRTYLGGARMVRLIVNEAAHP